MYDLIDITPIANAVESIATGTKMGTESCSFRKEGKAYNERCEEIDTIICTCDMEQYDNIPYGCGWNHMDECWIERRKRRGKTK